MDQMTAALPRAAGAYALVLDLARPAAVSVRGARLVLPAGRYLYAGSARGPGGIRARAARHLRRPARPHWHIDQLTREARPTSVLALPGGDECAIVRRLLRCPGVAAPVPGFGSSDCRTCPAHLLALPAAMAVAELARLLGAQTGGAQAGWRPRARRCMESGPERR